MRIITSSFSKYFYTKCHSILRSLWFSYFKRLSSFRFLRLPVPNCLSAVRFLRHFVPSCLSTLVPFSLNALVPKSFSAFVPFSLNALVPLCLSAFLLSCSSNLTPTEYLSYYEHNRSKLTKTIERNNVKAIVAYMPAEYYAALAMQNDTTLLADSALKRYENSIFFVLNIKAAADSVTLSPLLTRNGMAGFKESVERNTFDRDQDVFLLYGKDTVKTVGIQYERNWGVGNDDSFLLGFSKKSLKDKLGKYHLILRNMTPEMGTIDLAVKNLRKTTKRLKG